MARLPLRIATLIVLSSTFLLFYSGYALQQQSLALMSEALRPPPPLPPPPPAPAPNPLAHLISITSSQSLCNAVMLFADLAQSGSTLPRVLHYPKSWDDAKPGSTTNRLLKNARTYHGVSTKAIEGLEAANAKQRLRAVMSDRDHVRFMVLDPLGCVLSGRDLDTVLKKQEQNAEDKVGVVTVVTTNGQVLEEGDGEDENAEGEERTMGQVLKNTPGMQVEEVKDVVVEMRELRTSEWQEGAAYVSFRGVPEPWKIGGGAVTPKGEAEARTWRKLYKRWRRRRVEVCGLDLVAG